MHFLMLTSVLGLPETLNSLFHFGLGETRLKCTSENQKIGVAFVVFQRFTLPYLNKISALRLVYHSKCCTTLHFSTSINLVSGASLEIQYN